MGYGDTQIHDLEATLDAGAGRPRARCHPDRHHQGADNPTLPVVRVRYELEPVSGTVAEHLAPVIARAKEAQAAGR